MTSPSNLWVLLAGGFLITTGVAAIGSSATILLVKPLGCSAVNRALPILLVAMAVWFVANIAFMALLARNRYIPGMSRLGMAGGYGLALIVTFILAASAVKTFLVC